MPSSLQDDSILKLSKDAVFSEVAGELVILDQRSGKYFGLDPVGTRIWKLIQDGQTLKKIHDTLLEEFEVDAAKCWQDLEALVQQLVEKGLAHLVR